MQILEKYFKNLTAQQIEQFSLLGSVYTEWNEKINVISRKDIELLYEKHVLHALSIAKVISFKPGTSILDVGTGGGFPGIPLAIMFPDCKFHLVDSIGKKITVVKEVSSAIGLKNLKAEQKRAENVRDKYDFVTNRAVTRMNRFIPWVQNNIKEESFNDLPNGILSLKGGDLDEELKECKLPFKKWGISEFFEEEFFETKSVVHMTLSKG